MSLKRGLMANYGIPLLRSISCRSVKTSTIINAHPEAQQDGEFRTLELVKKRSQRPARENRDYKIVLPPRYKQQEFDQDWGNVWPAARTFHPATVPLPIRQGYPIPKLPKPSKWGNAELMKIPNFLHLTPAVIERQCLAIKKFCTAWPEGLETRQLEEAHFPVTVTKNSYLHSSPSIRDPKSRIVIYEVNLKSLELDDHGRDKLLRLVGDRYNAETDSLTIVSDRCPVSQQNHDYCNYLLSVLYTEAVKTEPWEHEKEVVDREMYIWEGSPSQAALKTVIEAKTNPTPEEVVKEYEEAVTDLHNEGEDEETVSRYREAVLKIIAI